MNSDFQKKYEPKNFEEKIYKSWEEKWKFKPKESKTWETYYIPMPPPNVTSHLHIGHSVMLTLEDIMARYHKMKWDSTLLLPWTDHAGISTQIKVEEKLLKEGKNKSDISREEFLEECWSWTKKYSWQIQNQFRKMWTSCDWSKERFTLDEWMNKRVIEAFVDLYNKWLIYRGEYMVNYDPILNTVVSDQEVIIREEKWFLYHITYFVSGSDNEIIIATTRPETLLWDVAVAVHPKDKKYNKLLKFWKKLILPIVNKEIPIIADEMVDMDFWTGAVKITPAHDPNDFELGKKHDLPLDKVVLWKNWNMTEIAWIFAWQDYKTARENIVELLKAKWNLVKMEPHNSNIAYSERSWAKIETIISEQWFIKIAPITKKLIQWYKNKDFEIIPKKFNKIFEDWLFNLKDWCISRQLQWGHRIPVYYNNTTWEQLVTTDDLSNNKDYTQDSDVLDTWFSSALRPFSTLDYNVWWLEQSDLFKKFYPAQVLETWHDIIFFWVVRMLLFWYEFTWQTPFKKIYLHWLVRDKFGKKMSKSLWNGINPIDMIEKYWTDALRLTLSIWNTPWNDLRFDEANVENNKIFINKLWNASRFVYVNIWTYVEAKTCDIEIKNFLPWHHMLEDILIKNYDKLMLHEKWILSRIRYLADLVTQSMEDYDFSISWQELYSFTKNEFCDYFIEEFKITKDDSKYSKEVVIYLINILLKLWHPYIPFVTEEIYRKLWFEWDLIDSDWPKLNIKRDVEIEKDKILIMDIIREIRKLRSENNIFPAKTIWVQIYSKNKDSEIIKDSINLIWNIVKAENITFVTKKTNNSNFAYSVLKSWVEIYVDTKNAVDMKKEIERIKEQISDTKEYIAILDKKLLNESFVRKAPAELVRSETDKKKQASIKLGKLEEKLGNLV